MHLLLDVVSKGGNLALNLAPQPDGELPGRAVASLRDMGRWLRMHGEGIYETVIAEPFFERNIKYTKKGKTIYAFYLYEDYARRPLRVHLTVPDKISRVRLMRTGQDIPFEQKENKIILDTETADRNTAFYADCFILE